ncbi:hypothetical protein HW555_012435 [Spodoptera exigua]|uniref:Uncharacterized protein n=1 Tax=Spodoptera exigua TaxID=7107 RepID=A0A835KZ22_SPOEX|nr:hypothetical protein HW555_012435 [Spodoptera exigua]
MNLEEAFANLEKELKTDVDSLTQKKKWKKRSHYSPPWETVNKVKLDEFLNVVGQIALQLSKTLEDIAKRLMETPPASAKTAKVVDDTKEQEDKLRSLFNDVPDKKNVSLDQFKGILQKFCDEFKKNMEGLATQLATTAGASMVQSLAGTATAGLPGLLGKK